MNEFDVLSADGIRAQILPEFKEASIEVFDSISSTNIFMKECGSKLCEGSIIAASHQTSGRGRLGRSFYSPTASGIYISILLRPSLSLQETTAITTCAAVAVCEAIETVTDLKPAIKWVNDIFLNDKKVCGILTEAVLNTRGELDFCVLGIGLNVYPPENGFPDEIQSIATALVDAPQNGLRNRLTAAIYNSFMKHYSKLSSHEYIPLYKKRCFVLGKQISVVSPTSSRSAVALDIDDDCRLLVRFDDGHTEYISTGEISIRV